MIADHAAFEIREIATLVASDFDVILFRSLQNSPPLAEVLDHAIGAISSQHAQQADELPDQLPDQIPDQLSDKLTTLITLFRERRCLLILDSLETIMSPGELSGTYRAGYEAYGELLQAVSKREHQSCLLVTSREKPTELGPFEGRGAPVRTLPLTGLTESACRLVLETRDVFGSPSDVQELTRLYGGNPFALNLVAEPIRELFGGDVRAFLASGHTFFNGVTKLMELQCSRTTQVEKSILYWLAIKRELVPLEKIITNLRDLLAQRGVLLALESLRRRMQIERSADHPAFTLQPVILEFITAQIVTLLHDEIVTGQPNLLQSHAIVQATAKEYVRRSQEELIAKALLQRLLATLRDPAAVEQRLQTLLASWRGQPHSAQEYGPGNVVNLLRLLRGDLKGQDFSNLYLRQLYLQGVAAHDTTFANSHLVQSILQEPFASIESVACSPDMRYMAVGTVNGEVRLWEVADRKVVLAEDAHVGIVLGMAFSADGRLLASGSTDGTVRLWEVESGTSLALLEHHQVVYGVALSADGCLLACGVGAGTVWVWDVRDPSHCTCLSVLQGHSHTVWGIAFSADGRLLASSSFDGTVRLWEVGNLQQGAPCLAVLQGHTSAVWSVAMSANGRLLISGDTDGTVRLWDVDNAQGNSSLATVHGYTDAINSVALSPDSPSASLLRTLRAERVYERLQISGLTGITEAQRSSLIAMGAIES